MLLVAAVAGILVFGAVRLLGSSDTVAAGEVAALGDNGAAQRGGDNTRTDRRLEPLALAANMIDTRFAQVKAGHYHTLLLSSEGKVFALGGNEHRTIRDSNIARFPVPQQIIFDGLKEDERIVQIDVSRDHNLALTSGGRVFAWGSNSTGQLGDGSNKPSGIPKVVDGLPYAIRIAAGYRHSAAITRDGSVFAWGGKCTEEGYSKAKELLEQAGGKLSALGAYGSTAHSEDGDQIEDCATQDSTFVQSYSPQKLNGFEARAKDISAGYGHLLVLSETGDIYSAGCNTHKQLGRDKSKDGTRNDLVRVDLQGKVSAISAGYRHSIVLLTDGRMVAWGYNGDGYSLGTGSTDAAVPRPTLVTGDDVRYTAVEAAHDTTFAVTVDGQIMGWGQDNAAAFWPDVTPKEKQQLEKERAEVLGLSAGMRHLTVLSKK